MTVTGIPGVTGLHLVRKNKAMRLKQKKKQTENSIRMICIMLFLQIQRMRQRCLVCWTRHSYSHMQWLCFSGEYLEVISLFLCHQGILSIIVFLFFTQWAHSRESKSEILPFHWNAHVRHIMLPIWNS